MLSPKPNKVPNVRRTSSSRGRGKNDGRSNRSGDRSLDRDRRNQLRSPPSQVQRNRPATVPFHSSTKLKRQPFPALKRLSGGNLTLVQNRRQDSGFSSTSTTSMSTSDVASAAFAPLLSKYASPGLLPLATKVPCTTGNEAKLEKGEIWKRLGERPRLGSDSSTPPPSPNDVNGHNSKFLEFRQKWEANVTKEKNMMPSSRPPVVVAAKDKVTEKVLRAGSGGTGSKIQASSTVTCSTEKVKAGQRGDPIKQVCRISVSTRESYPPVSRIPRGRVVKETLLKPEWKGSQPFPPHVVPVSWKKSAQDHTATYNKPRNQQNVTPVLTFTAYNNNSTDQYMPYSQLFGFPMTYPFGHSAIQPLKQLASDAKKEMQSSFGWFNPTSSLLNPILPGLPRLKKPDDLKIVDEPSLLTVRNLAPHKREDSSFLLPSLKYISNSTIVEGMLSDDSENDDAFL